MKQKEFYNLLETPYSNSSQEIVELTKLIEQYPFFQAARVLHLQNHYKQDKYLILLSKHGIHIPSPSHYYKQLMYNKIYNKNTPPKENTNEEEETPTLVYAPSVYKLPELDEKKNIEDNNSFSEDEKYGFVSWLQFLEQDAQRAQIPQLAKPDKTLLKPMVSAKEKDKKDKPIPTQSISQTLAEIYVKQKLYDKAIAIYEKLSLNSSEKNTTFARRIKEINDLKE